MEGQDDETLSISERSDSGDGFTSEPEDDDVDYKSSSSSSSSSPTGDANDTVVTGHKTSKAFSPPPGQDRKSRNVAALVRGNLVVKRQSLLPRVYSVTDVAARLRKPFKPPCPEGYGGTNEQLARRLWARKRFVPWGSTMPTFVAITNRLNVSEAVENDAVEECGFTTWD